MDQGNFPPQSPLISPPPVGEPQKPTPANPLTTVFIIILFLLLGAGIITIGKYVLTETTEETSLSENTAGEAATVITLNGKNTVVNENKNQTVQETSPTPPSQQNLESGEVVFFATSKNGSPIREIHIHNPLKDYWILVYDGYRKVGATPTEIFRVRLGSLTYDRLRVRTFDNFIEEPREIIVKEGQTTNVIIDL